jgi:hypothetical protein
VIIIRRGRKPSKGLMIFALMVAAVIAVVMIWAGIFLLVQRQTGPRAMATVDDCVTTGSGRYRSTHCTGSWIVGGSLLEGGHVVVGTINDADQSQVGKTIEVTLRGDEAYTRDLILPLMLLGFGLVPAVGLLLWLRVALRARSLGQKT